MKRPFTSLFAYPKSKKCSLRRPISRKTLRFFAHGSACLNDTKRPRFGFPITAIETPWDIPYFHMKETKEEEMLYGSEILDSYATFTVYLRDRKVEFEPQNFLQACWTTGFDTLCSICNKEFDLAVAPPVRLLGLNREFLGTQSVARALPPPTLTNNHLRCLRAANVKYFPVSHAWHSSVAEAYALRISNLSAAKACYGVPIQTLLSVVQRFGPDAKIWHDYISIPQWQDNFRGTTVLPQIFEVFKASGCAIIQLAYQLPVEPTKTSTPEDLIDHVSSLQCFFGAHLFSRMWPVIEFDQAGDAYIMDGKYKIMPRKFSSFVNQMIDVTTIRYPECPESVLKWIEDLPLFFKERQTNKCLGYVFDMISGLGCRSFRDKFIGASAMLEIPDYPTSLPSIPQEACLWLSEKRLEGSDLSPLLLRPSNEPIYEKARWLKGHTRIAANMWGLGAQTKPARVTPRLQDHAIYLELELVGRVTNIFSWKVRSDDNSNGFQDVLQHVVKLTGGSAARFVENLERIYPSQFLWTKSTSNSYQFPALRYDIPQLATIETRLEHLLERYTRAITKNHTIELKSLCNVIIALLELSAPPSISNLGAFANFSRLQLYNLLCDPSEYTLISVACLSCARISAFRATLWQKPTAHAQLYLIPGLAYQYSLPEGMGIILENEEIIGRVRFNTSPCGCSRSSTVRLS